MGTYVTLPKSVLPPPTYTPYAVSTGMWYISSMASLKASCRQSKRYGRLTPKPSEWCRSLQNFSQCVLTVHPVAVAAALIDQPENLEMGTY